MHNLVASLASTYPHFTFKKGAHFRWDPDTATITYENLTALNTLSLLHEVGHGVLGHASFTSDADLLQKELAAWEEAKKLAKHFGVPLDNEYMQDCLDTYRDWQFLRSRCPLCTLQGIQKSPTGFYCLNCSHMWNVSQERFCRPYRLSA